MKIAVIGAGNVGEALGGAWTRAGHDVVYGVREPAGEKTRALLARHGGRAASPKAAASEANVLLLALPWGAAEAAVKDLGDLTGKTLIDAMNPLAMTPQGLGLERGFSTSGAEAVAAWAPGAHVVKGFNQTGAEIMANARVLAHPPAMLFAGDDAAAKETAMGLARDIGFDAMDAGALRQARNLEAFAMVWINQALMRGKGRDWAFAAVGKPRA